MRRFRVGDQVRVKLNLGHSVDGVVVKENQDTTDPRVVPTIVTRISTDYKIASLPEDVELVEAVEDQQKCKKCGGAGWVWGRELDDPSEDTYQDDMTKYSCDWCNRDDDEDQQSFSLEGCVEHKSGGDVIVGKDQIRCETCYHWDERESICGGAGTCDKHDLWAPKPEPTKTMTVDEVEEKIGICLYDWSVDVDDQRSRSRAIAEALRGVTVKQ